MKTLTLLLLATALSGCAGIDANKFAQSFGEGMQQQSRQVQAQRPVYTATAVKQTDFQCMNNCTASGYQYGLCQSKCTY